MKIKTLEDARDFVKEVKICTIFPSDKVLYTSLYENVDLPEKQPGESGWGERMEAVWPWKNQLPSDYPNEIYYGKIKGGFAVLMDMDFLEQTHFPASYKSVSSLNQLARQIFEKIRVEPWTTPDLRNEIIHETGCSKSQFDTALKNLQISLNVVRACDAEQDTWLSFEEVYSDIWNKYISDES
ncbi:AlkZ-related protein [Pontiella sulfatireligans]|uniref:Uncharacterized protein n=1 Tax=Pontiella sulfatireligans TaxID=2750658 RepID=A0A6C2UUN6_9BACT|nr:hypothetical protein [Pontiella sulfatireligans]VGO22884.1 hypothetical protein SCARR_04981 [Pontiella sulfatireligans]